VQKNRGRERCDKHRPNDNPSPPDRYRDRIIEHIAMPPFRFAASQPGIYAATLEARRANVFCSQLQIAQRAHEPAAPLTASLKRLIRMKKARRLVRHRGGSTRILPQGAPPPDLQAFPTEGAALPSRLCLNSRDISATVGARNSSRRGGIFWGAERVDVTRSRSEQIDVHARIKLRL
jgi:hypothetical protein